MAYLRYNYPCNKSINEFLDGVRTAVVSNSRNGIEFDGVEIKASGDEAKDNTLRDAIAKNPFLSKIAKVVSNF